MLSTTNIPRTTKKVQRKLYNLLFFKGFHCIIGKEETTGKSKELSKKIQCHSQKVTEGYKGLQTKRVKRLYNRNQPTGRNEIRQKGIKARIEMEPDERVKKSRVIVDKLLQSNEFKNAKTIMLYRGMKGEVELDSIADAPESKDKILAYPLCIDKSTMIALVPKREEAWACGSYGIMEPIRDQSAELEPGDIDLVICPCTAFDECRNRVGMGAGYYDRYLPQCEKAQIIAVAFECQKSESVPVESWDVPMKKIFTEENVY